MKKRKDKYDREIEYLTKRPNMIGEHWMSCSELFKFCGTGCLTQIRGGGERSYTPELTREIRRDGRIPKKDFQIKVSDLPVFAEWQRRLDKELNRK